MNTNITTAPLFKHHDRGVLDASIALSAPESIGNKSIRKAVEALIEAVDRGKRNTAELQAARARVQQAREADLQAVDRLVRAGEDLPEDLHELENEAKAALERVEAQTEPLNRLYASRYREVETAIAENGLEWASASARELDDALNTLVSIRRQIETVAAKVNSHYGVVTLATKGVDYTAAGRQIMSMEDTGASRPLEHAVQAVTDSLRAVSDRVEVARAAKRADVDARVEAGN